MEQAVHAIATLLGLEDLHPGRHILRDKKRQRAGELFVSKAWYASVAPAFHDRAVIAVVRAEDTVFRGKTTPGFLRAGMSVVSLETSALKQAVVADIEFDPLPDAVRAVDILASDETLCLDGIGYQLNTQTRACHATLDFSNPREPCFCRIEDSLVAVATQVADTSQEPTVIEYIEMWQGYLAKPDRMS